MKENHVLANMVKPNFMAHLRFTIPHPTALQERVYLAICRQLALPARPAAEPVPVREEVARLVGQAVASGRLSATTFICASEHVARARFLPGSDRGFDPTPGEVEMFQKASLLRTAAGDFGIRVDWQLIVADPWSRPEFCVHPEGSDQYPARILQYKEMLVGLALRSGWPTFSVSLWTKTIETSPFFAPFYSLALKLAEPLAPWEADQGETGRDSNPPPAEKLAVAARHIALRASEAWVLLNERGPQIILSTEDRDLTRYDNLVVASRNYGHAFVMPHYPHRADKH